jgi:hypothetical protein
MINDGNARTLGPNSLLTIRRHHLLLLNHKHTHTGVRGCLRVRCTTRASKMMRATLLLASLAACSQAFLLPSVPSAAAPSRVATAPGTFCVWGGVRSPCVGG